MERTRISGKTSLIRDCDGLYLVTEENVEDLIDENRRLQNEKANFRGQRHKLHVAELPNALYWQLLQKFGPAKHNPTDWKRWLNDPENRHFRTWHGTV